MTHETICPVCGHDTVESGEHFDFCPDCGYRWGTFLAFTEGVKHRKKSEHRARCKTTTDYQREVIVALFAGGHMAKYGNRYRVWDRKKNPLRKFSVSTFLQIKKFCRQNRNKLWVIDLKKVRSLRRNTWVKKYYLQLVRL